MDQEWNDREWPADSAPWPSPPPQRRRRWYHIVVSLFVFVVLIPAIVRGVLNAVDNGANQGDAATSTLGSPSSRPGAAARSCESYAASLAASYKRSQQAHRGDPLGQSQAIADTLRNTQGDAPNQLAADVALLADGFDAYVDALERIPNLSDVRGDPAKLRETLAASGASQIFEDERNANANFEIWRTCPNLDSGIGSNTMIGDTLLAIGGSESEMDEESLDCIRDTHAQKLGDNSGCDALQRACSDRNFNACNDLHYFANEGTAYQKFGASCGGIAKPGDKYVAGLCDMRDEAP